MKYKATVLFVLFFAMLGFPDRLLSQSYDADYTVNYINKHLGDACKIFSERKHVRVEFYAGGQLVRIDHIFPDAIDYETGINYNEEEGAIIVSCYEQAGKCIQREILKHGSRLPHERTTLTTGCTGADCKSLETAFKHLIMLYVLDDYERTQPFEEN